MKDSKEKIKINFKFLGMFLVIIFIGILIFFSFKYSFTDTIENLSEETKKKIELIATTIDEPTYAIITDGNDKYVVIFANQEKKEKYSVKVKEAKSIDGVLSINVKYEQSEDEKEKGFALVKMQSNAKDVYVYYESEKSNINSTETEKEIEKFEGSSLIDPYKKGLNIGYINEAGEIIIPTEYSSMIDKGEYLVASKIIDDRKQYGIIDKKGKEIFEFVYESIEILKNKNIQVVKINDNKTQTAVYKLDGTMVQDWVDGYVRNFNSGYAIIGNALYIEENRGTVGLVDENYQIVVPRIYDKLELEDYCYKVYLNDKVGLITPLNEIVVPIEYDEKTEFEIKRDYDNEKYLIYVKNENNENKFLKEIEMK